MRAQGAEKFPERGSDSKGMEGFISEARYVSLCSAWSRGTSKVKTTAVQIDGLHVPPSTCCVHAVPASSQVLTEEALLKVKKQHERGLARGSGKCLQNIRNDMEEAFRARPLPLVLCPGLEATEDESDAVRLAADFVANKTIQDLTSSLIVEELNRHLPGKWRLDDSGVQVRENSWRLRDSLSVLAADAQRVLITASLPSAPETRLEKSGSRVENMKATMEKVRERGKRTKGTPEAENAGRVLKKLKTQLQILEK